MFIYSHIAVCQWYIHLTCFTPCFLFFHVFLDVSSLKWLSQKFSQYFKMKYLFCWWLGGIKGHVSFCHHLSSVGSVLRGKLSQLNLLLWNHWTKLNLARMVLGWPLFKMVSNSPTLHSRWLLLLKIEISSFS